MLYVIVSPVGRGKGPQYLVIFNNHIWAGEDEHAVPIAPAYFADANNAHRDQTMLVGVIEFLQNP